MRKWVPLTILILLAALIGSSAWLLYTPSGARFFLTALSRLTPVQVTAGSINGRLATGLDLSRVEVRITGIRFSIDVGRVQWSWQPARLMAGTLGMEKLRVEDVHIMDDTPVTPGWRLSLPVVPRFLATQQAWIRDFSALRARYDRNGREAVRFDSVAARVFWHHGTLSASNLAVESPFFSVRGSGEAGFLSSLLKTDMTADLGPRDDRAGTLSVRMDLKRTKAPEHMAGPLFIVFTTPGKSRLSMDSRVGLEDKLVRIKSFTFSLSDLAGSLSGRGSIDTSIEEPYMRMDGRFTNLAAMEGAARSVVLSGAISAEGRPGDYRGSFRAAGRRAGDKQKAWEVAQANGSFKGGTAGAEVSIAEGRWLGGAVTGSVRTAWTPAFSLSSSLHGRGINPAMVSPDWKGTINVDTDLNLEEEDDSIAGSVAASFPRSILRGRPLFGDLKVSFHGDSVRLEKLALHGNGFDISASGALQERIAFEVAASDLSGLVPSVSGSLSGSGWLQRRASQWTGSVTGRGSAIATGGARVERTEFSASMAGAGGKDIEAAVRAQGVNYERFRADRLNASVKGSQSSHTMEGTVSSGRYSVKLSLQGGLREKQWEGRITSLSGNDPEGAWRLDAPAPLLVSRSRLQVGAMKVSGPGKEGLGLQADLFFGPLRGSLSAQWDNLNLARLNPFLANGNVAGAANRPGNTKLQVGGRIEGTTSGGCSIKWSEVAASRRIEAQTTVAGLYREKTLSIPLKGQGRATWDGKGLNAGWNATLDGGGQTSGTITASGPPEMQLPERATVNAGWQAMDIALVDAWLPANLDLKGRLSGRVDGSILPGKAVSLTGQAEITRGSAGWKGRNGAATTQIQTGTARFEWTGASLRGNASVVLAGYGRVDGRFSLPLPARLPPAIDADGPINLALTGQVREQGLVAAAMPGVVQEAKGSLTIDVKGSGTWRKPDIRGGATLKDASAYLPAAGVRLEKLAGEAIFSGDALHARLRAESGGGWLEAAGDVRMQNGEVFTYAGTIEGANFRVLNLPDVRAYVNPKLRFNGTPKLLTARGEITVPTMSIYSRQSQTVVRPSSDIRIVDLPKKEKKGTFPLGLDVQVRITLGNSVRLDVTGLTGRLAGAVDLNIAGAADKITANGRFRIVDGRYDTYGVRLVVTRGNISFTGPVEPTLDILAVRQTGQSEDVTAGVIVSGTADKPIINLYSNRPMSDSNKLAYLVLGHPVTQGQPGQSSLFSGGAGAFEGGATPTSAAEVQTRMGLAGTGGSLSGQDQTVSSTIGIGRYLTPSFYVGVGRSLLTNENQVTLRYSLSKKWEVESRAGGVTGMDLFYKIEFD